MVSIRTWITINSKMSMKKMKKRSKKRKRRKRIVKKNLRNKSRKIQLKRKSLKNKPKRLNNTLQRNCNLLLKIKMIKNRFCTVLKNKKKQNKLKEIKKSLNLSEIL